MHDYRFSLWQCLTMKTRALPSSKHRKLQNSVTSKNTLIFYHHNAWIKKDTVNWACSNLHEKFISKSGKKKIQYRTLSVYNNTQIKKYPKKQMQTRAKGLAGALEKKLASPWCNTHKPVHYIQCQSVYSRTKSITDVNGLHQPISLVSY
jgi:hypothetical protein